MTPKTPRNASFSRGNQVQDQKDCGSLTHQLRRPASKHQVPTTNMMLKIWQKGHCEHQRRCVRSTSRDESLWTFDSTFLQHITNFTGQAWWEVGEQHRDWAPLGALTV
ncbi:unnamed protein product [Durusdinium trenchii]|uniref:Uncharacterized protein n=2 Tax=Durusdinium trenchii TaxID=1381693 RepID=A0ABP0QQP4_9DINO